MTKMFKYFSFLLITLQLIACGGSDKTENLGNFDTRIINGTEHGATELPQFVKLITQVSDGSYGFCTGTMIGAKTVLTAAHCIEGAIALVAQVGDNSDTDPTYQVEEIIYDQNYGMLPDGRLVNDIAFVHLTTSPNLPILPILASSNVETDEHLMIVGFGISHMEDEFGTRRAGTMKVKSVDPYHIVSTFEPSLSNICFGDSGRPIIKIVKDPVTGESLASAVAGVASWGTTEDCAVGEMLFFTNISSYLSGIETYVPDVVFY